MDAELKDIVRGFGAIMFIAIIAIGCMAFLFAVSVR